MNIGIIGAGHIGGTLARQLVDLGHEVRIANSRGPETLGDVAASTGAQAATREDAVRDADLVVLTIPFSAVSSLPAGLFDSRRPGAPIVDTNNYFPLRDGRIAALLDGTFTAESRWVEQQIGAPVVKAFNNIIAQHLIDRAAPKDAPDRVALPVFGDDQRTKAAVMEVIETLGFDAIDAGSIDESWRTHMGTPGFTTDLGAADLRRALAEATVEQNVGLRESLLAGAAR
jgi:8-hydroxy-5-deazaflavin:NADPH oxidoreductase